MYKKAENIFIKVEAYRGEHLLLRSLTTVFVLSLVAYGYFVGLSIMNLIASKEATAMTEQLKSEVAALEKEYFALSSAMKPDVGAHLGLAPTAERSYVRRVGAFGLSTIKGGGL